MKVVNGKNLSVEQLIIALAERERWLYEIYQDRIIMEGENAPETLAAMDNWIGVWDFMQYMIVGVENTENVGSIEL